MNAKVDVLAILREFERRERVSSSCDLDADRLAAASDVIRELIDAADDYVNGEDPAAGCETEESAREARMLARVNRANRLRAAIEAAQP